MNQIKEMIKADILNTFAVMSEVSADEMPVIRFMHILREELLKLEYFEEKDVGKLVMNLQIAIDHELDDEEWMRKVAVKYAKLLKNLNEEFLKIDSDATEPPIVEYAKQMDFVARVPNT